MATPVPRMQDETYLNWLRESEALFTLKAGLENFTDKRVSDLHEELHTKVHRPYSKNGPFDPLKSKQQAVPYVQICKTCTNKDVQRHNNTWRVRCPSMVCNTWIKHIIQYHIDGPSCDIAKLNLKPQLWPSHPWEVAKCYLPSGSERINSASDAGVAAVLELLSRCCFMIRYMKHPSLIKELLAIHHGLMHSNTQSVSDNQLKQHTEKMVEFLKSLEDLSPTETETIQRTIDTITKIMDGRFTAEPSYGGHSHSRASMQNTLVDLDSEFQCMDGRLQELKKTRIEQLMDLAKELSEGGFGTTYVVDDHTICKQRIVIKKICYKDKLDHRNSAIKEMLASRLKHHGIVPLLSMTWDLEKELYYFVMPFMEKGDLNKALEEDRERYKNEQFPILTKQIRLKILMQLAAVLQFLHTRVKYFRGPYVHADVTSKNIVLDGKYNMRLLDFGLSKEKKGDIFGTTVKSSKKSGTDGYRAPTTTGELSQQTDIFSYGVVVLELVTGQPPVDEYGEYLHNEDVLTYMNSEIQHIWRTESVPEKLVRIAKDCKEQMITATQIIDNHLTPILEEFAIDHFDHTDDVSKCTLCMTNPTVKSDILDHGCGLRVCVACIRSSYLNPIRCHVCHMEVNSPIGHGWGAILIAGNDIEKPAIAKSFKTDVDRFKRAITSKRQASMRISVDDVKCVQPYETGTPESLTDKLEAAIIDLVGREHIQTLMIYFTGHANAEHELILGNVRDTIKEENISKMLDRNSQVKHRIKKVIVILDCCMPSTTLDYTTDKNTNESTTIIKLTAARPNEYADVAFEQGSLFTSLLVQCLAGEEAKTQCTYSKNYNQPCKVCQDDALFEKCKDGFISLDYLIEYIERHMKAAGCSSTPTSNTYQADWRATKIAFFTPKLQPIEIYSDTTVYLTLEKLPENTTELFDRLHSVARDTHRSATDQNLLVKYFKEIYAIVLETGSSVQPTKELVTLEQIESAWNGLCKLLVLPRKIHLINLNRSVGIFLHGPANTTSVRECSKRQWKDEGTITETQDAWQIDIPLRSLGKSPCDSICSDKDMMEAYKVLRDEILRFVNSSGKFKDKDWQLVMKFPYKSTERVIEEKFFIVYFKGDEDPSDELI